MIQSDAPSAMPAPPGVGAKKTRKMSVTWASTICRSVPLSTPRNRAQR